MYDLIRLHPRIRQATWDDFALIEGWRAAHFLEMEARGNKRGVVGQAEFSTACWAVYTDAEDKPLAAIGFIDYPQEKQRRATDLFASATRAGKRAGVVLVAMLEEMSDQDGFEIRGATDPENTDYLKHVLARGYEITSIEFRRVPHAE